MGRRAGEAGTEPAASAVLRLKIAMTAAFLSYCAVQPPSMEKLAPLAEAPRSLTR